MNLSHQQRTLLLAVLMFGVAASSFGQGAITFANYGGGGRLDAPVTNAAGTRITGPPYVAHFFWSSNTQATMDSLEPAGTDTTFSDFQGGGYFLSGSLYLPVAEIPILSQVRVWDTNYGSNYYQARDKGGEFGFSNIITVHPSVPPGTPTTLFGLVGFQLQRLPHVTTALTTTNTIVLSWQTQQTAYAVQQSPDVSSTNWTTLAITPVTVGQQQQVVTPVTNTARMFYRLVSQ
jgi:hypothetical protein